ncbi:hypothetical protein [Nocardioides panaciterrulae]|uniref:DUF2568 domain-containing protein n=1 Tax=Nocardioides panaciterrulae TaxID=661492 RepID=A0A7Y9E6W6_9ACTN|nr:hypothetical protein [Nocardioides panaciterrulae]NYD42255.1 hypothetical protein [Nocardioides panaciterrulae]
MARSDRSPTGKAQREPYVPERARQLLMTLWVVVALGGWLLVWGVWLLFAGAAVGLVVMLVLLPAIAMLTLAGWSRGVLHEGDASARVAVPVTATVTTVAGLLLSSRVTGVLLLLVGILLLLLALLPGRDDDHAPPAGR